MQLKFSEQKNPQYKFVVFRNRRVSYFIILLGVKLMQSSLKSSEQFEGEPAGAAFSEMTRVGSTCLQISNFCNLFTYVPVLHSESGTNSTHFSVINHSLKRMPPLVRTTKNGSISQMHCSARNVSPSRLHLSYRILWLIEIIFQI